MSIDVEKIEKAAQTVASKSSEAAPVVTETTEVTTEAPVIDKGAAPETQKPETTTEWDGDVNKLPPELQTWAKKAQGTLTKKAMANSEALRLGEEYKAFQKSEEWQKFQQWKQNPTPQAARVEQAPQQPGQITAQEWEEAQLDPTGAKFNDLLERKVNARLNEAAKFYGKELQQLRTTQQVTEFQQVLSDFADLNPDVTKLHEMGIMKPILDEEMRSGRHKSYEEMVNAAYTRGAKIRDIARQEAVAEAQLRVAEKKNGVTATGTSTGSAEIVYVDKGNTLDTAINFALQEKKVKVKSK
jgi:hypothetical protein